VERQVARRYAIVVGVPWLVMAALGWPIAYATAPWVPLVILMLLMLVTLPPLVVCYVAFQGLDLRSLAPKAVVAFVTSLLWIPTMSVAGGALGAFTTELSPGLDRAALALVVMAAVEAALVVYVLAPLRRTGAPSPSPG
jgi:hypothetical protein